MTAEDIGNSLNAICDKGFDVSAVVIDTVKVDRLKYVFSFEGREHESKTVECSSLDEARNEAVRYLGIYYPNIQVLQAKGIGALTWKTIGISPFFMSSLLP